MRTGPLPEDAMTVMEVVVRGVAAALPRVLAVAFSVLIGTLAAPAGVASAAELRQGNDVVIPADETIDDDLYVGGKTVTIQGVVLGDVVAGGADVTISGHIAGDVLAGGRTVDVPGRVEGSLRAAADHLTVSGAVGHDVVVAGDVVQLATTSHVGRDLLVGANDVRLGGTVDRNVLATGGELTLMGHVRGDTRLRSGTVHLTDGAALDGDLTYSSQSAAIIDKKAIVHGAVRYQPSAADRATPEPVTWLSDAATRALRGSLGFLVLGLPFVVAFPRLSRRAAATIRASAAKSLGTGLGFLVVVPVVIAVVFVAGLALGGWWLAPILLGLYGGVAALGVVVATLFVGQTIALVAGRSDRQPLNGLLLGLAFLALLFMVPYLGPCTVAAAVIVGTGGLVLATLGTFERLRRRRLTIAAHQRMAVHGA